MGRSISFKGSPLTIHGPELKVGSMLPDFRIVGTDMQDLTESDFEGQVMIITAVPSVDTPVCNTETKRFNHAVTELPGAVTLLTVSMDLPFALKRFCAAEGIEHAISASDYKYQTFGEAFGVYAEELGLLARAVFVVDANRTIQYVEYVSEISTEPNYEAALNAARTLVS